MGNIVGVEAILGALYIGFLKKLQRVKRGNPCGSGFDGGRIGGGS
jgi:hypothetical protein